MQTNKTVLVDADGVLLAYEYAFNLWVQDQGFVQIPGTEKEYDLAIRYGIPKFQSRNLVKKFNNTVSIGFLPAHRDAVEYVTKMVREGYKFHVITSLSENEEACSLRTKNLKKLFGEDAFEKFIYLDTGSDKDEALAKYAGSGLFWIEDKIENAEAGLKVGLKPILMAHGHNFEYVDQNKIPVLKNWKEIYEFITNERKV